MSSVDFGFTEQSSPFEVFGLPLKFEIDLAFLEEKYFQLSREIHPDRFVTASFEVKNQIQRLSAALNSAWLALKKPEDRLETLLRLKNLLPKETARSSPAVFADLAEEFFDIQDPDQAQNFAKKISAKRNEVISELYQHAARVNWNEPHEGEIVALLALREQQKYLDSLLRNLKR